MKNFPIRPVDIGDKSKSYSLKEIRQLYLNASTVLFLIVAVFLIFISIWLGEVQKLILLTIAVGCFLVVIYLSYNNRLEASIVSLCLALNSIASAAVFFHMLVPIEIIVQATLIALHSLFLLWDARIRKIYILFIIMLFSVTLFKFELGNLDRLMILIQVIALIIIFNYLVFILELQSKKLSFFIQDLRTANVNIDDLNQSLQTKNDEITNYLHIMSHELKSPIRSIISFVGLIKQNEILKNSESVDFFNFIETSTYSMNSLIENLLLFSRVNNGKIKIEELDVMGLINTVGSNLKSDLNIGKFNLEIGNLSSIRGNKELLSILFQNLLTNSIKFQPDKSGHIPTIKISNESDNGHHIIFSDNGIGINEAYIQNLFVPFKRYHNKKDYKGTGLGMSICLKIMQKHNGEIKLLKTSKEGTSFLLVFDKSLK